MSKFDFNYWNELSPIDVIGEFCEQSRAWFDKIVYPLIIIVFNEEHPSNISEGIETIGNWISIV
jgi:hypothetical protein